MLETIRQYAEEHLVASGDAEAVRARHAGWYGSFARAAGRGLYSTEELSWLERLEGEVSNLQVAVTFAVGADDTDLAMRLGGSFPRQGMARPLLGTATLAERASAVRDADQHPLRARVWAEAAWAMISRGDLEGGNRLLHWSIEAQHAGARYAAAAYMYMSFSFNRDDPYEGYTIARQGLDAAEAAGDFLGAIGSRIALAVDAMAVEHEDEALDYAQRALAEAREVGLPTLEAAALYANGLAHIISDPARALTLLHESIDLTERIGLQSERFAAFAVVAALEAFHGDERRALEAFHDQIAALPRIYPRADTFAGAQVFNRVGRPDLVARCDGMFRLLVSAIPPLFARFHRHAVEEARASLGSELFDRQAAEAASMPPEQFWQAMQREIDELLSAMPTS
jgi:hypothetical protein